MLEYFSEKFGWWIEMSDQYIPLSELFPNTRGYLRMPSLESLVDSMSKAIEKRSDCERKGLEAHRYVKENLSWDRMVERLVPILIAVYSKNLDEFQRMHNYPCEYYYHSLNV
jgi:hypothetical protein